MPTSYSIYKDMLIIQMYFIEIILQDSKIWLLLSITMR